MSASSPGALAGPALSWKGGVGFSALAVACFHVAYTPADAGWFSLAILGYVMALTQLARLRSTRQSFYFGLMAGFACVAPQLECFWRIFGPAAVPLWFILALWLALFTALSHIARCRLWRLAGCMADLVSLVRPRVFSQ
ncbi:MAG TPA: hypothetical protein PKN95_10510 [Verrucomicrobiota bacterium]|nr:hypothetical protein [Verrucomicrobiota bacterium]HNT14772.1 hypothetical protein [Verrucomicrobiota bacterium]